MKLSRRRFITITAGAAASLAIGPAIAGATTWRGIALGAEAKLNFHGVSASEGQRLISIACAEIERLEQIFSIYRQDSVLTKLNTSGRVAAPPLELLEVLSLAGSVNRETRRRFDPTIQPLWALYAERTGKPTRDQIDEARAKIGMDGVSVTPTEVRLKKQGMALTLNGIAQGYITDRIVTLLKANGLRNAVVNMGEISALGKDPSGDAWRIGLADNGDDVATDHVSLSDSSIATSAASGTTFDGIASHIIDPSNGLPIHSTFKRVSVIHKSAAMADGLSTGIIAMSEKELQSMRWGSATKVIVLTQSGKTIRL